MAAKINLLVKSALAAALLTLAPAGFTACDDDDDSPIVGDVSATPSDCLRTVAWDEVETSCAFTVNTLWTASTSETWIRVTVPEGDAGTVRMPIVLTKNDSDAERVGSVTVRCGDKSIVFVIRQAANPDAAHTMDVSSIENYDKYYTPGTWNDGFEKGPEGMLRSDARWSWWRMRQSEHFFVFWEPGFGDDPNAETVPEKMRVDVDDLLQKAEKFYETNVETLGMVSVGQGKSVLDNYKMQIYLLYQEEWLATGSGYDDMIGALWVNPSTCKPVGSTIGHEIGHSFQYQVSADMLYSGEAVKQGDLLPAGFRYGFGENGAGGCAFWEQCAQWQSFQDYPAEAFTQDANVQVFLSNHHRHFNHEWQRYASYWFPYYYTQKHGIEAYSRIWRESAYPEDPLETYTRLYCGGDLSRLYDDLYDYAARCANYDFDAVHAYVTESALNHSTKLYKTADGYQVSYSNCPGTTGFNLIALNVPAAGTALSATLTGLTPGSALAAGDPGTIFDGDGNAVAQTSSYNSQQNTAESFRFGFVAVKADGGSVYGDMTTGESGTASFTVPEGAERLYLCVLAAPTQYNRHAWDDDESNDEQWPYRVSFDGTDLLGTIEITPGDPHSATVFKAVNLDASSESYELYTFKLLTDGTMAFFGQAFKTQPTDLASAIVDDATASAEGFVLGEGQVAMGLKNPDGSISYAYSSYSANGYGFWIAADGSASFWGESPVYFEFNEGALSLTVGHMPGVSVEGTTYTIRPTFVYVKDGVTYEGVVDIAMRF